jgi:hypothetical protein
LEHFLGRTKEVGNPDKALRLFMLNAASGNHRSKKLYNALLALQFLGGIRMKRSLRALMLYTLGLWPAGYLVAKITLI